MNKIVQCVLSFDSAVVTRHNYSSTTFQVSRRSSKVDGAGFVIFTTSMAHILRAYKYVRLLHFSAQLFLKQGYTTQLFFLSVRVCSDDQ
jgi:hypothetical protein